MAIFDLRNRLRASRQVPRTTCIGLKNQSRGSLVPRPSWGRAGTAVIIASSIPLLVGCEAPPPPAAASNEVFGDGIVTTRDQGAGIDDRWASIVLDEDQREEIRLILEESVSGPVEPLVPARDGVRFEDTPRAMITAAPKVEMALLSTEHVPATAFATYRDSRGRQAVASIRIRERGPIAAIDYRVPGSDVARARAGQLIDIQDRLGTAIAQSGPGFDVRSAEAMLRASIRSKRGTLVSSRIEPEQYRMKLLMLDEQEATIVVRRVPPPLVVSVSAEAGMFRNDARAEALARAFDLQLRAWGRMRQPVSVDGIASAGDPSAREE